MKLVLRIFNIVILTLAAAATICLFAVPTFSLNSNIALDVKTFSEFVPQTEFTDSIDIAHLLGTDTIEVGISFSIGIGDTTQVMNGNREIINNKLISKNVDDIVDVLHEPVDLITDFTIRSVIKSTIESEITAQINQIIEDSGGTITMSAQDIKDEVGMDDAYFTNFSHLLYDSANEDGATVDSVTDVLFDQIDEALAEADYAVEEFDKSGFSEDNKTAIKANLLEVLNDLKLVNSDNTLKKFNQISYMYLSEYLRNELIGKVAESELEQKAGETTPDYADRLLGLFVLSQTPDVVYQVIGYVALGLFIGLFVFAAIWIILFTFTMIRTFSKNKPWTFFGPWFWFFGFFQIILGIGITVFGKFILPTLDLAKLGMSGIPLKKIILAPRTYALVPSMIFIVCIFVGIAYAVIKGIVKRQMRNNPNYPNDNNNGYNGYQGGYDNGYQGDYNPNGYNNNNNGYNGYDGR